MIPGHWWGKAEPIYIAVSPCDGECKGGVRDVTFSNITAEAESGILIYGADKSPITGLTLDRIRLKITAPDRSLAQSMGGNFDLRWTARNLKEAIFQHDIPAVYCRGVQDFRANGLELQWGDNLPGYFSDGVQCEQFRDVSIDHFEGRQAPRANGAALSFANGSGLSITGSTAANGTSVFAHLSNVTDRRTFMNYDLSAAKQAIVPETTTFRTSNRHAVQGTDPKKPLPTAPTAKSGQNR